jgi:STE24 endopeptidase
MSAIEILTVAQAGAFDAAQATRAYLDAMPADQAAQTAAYHEGQIWLILWNALVSIAVLWILLATRFAAGLRNWIEARMPKWVAPLPYAIVFTIVTSLLTWPLAYYQGFVREHAYGLATQSFSAWFSEWLMGFGIGTLIGGIFLWVLYLLIKALKNSWWIFGTVVSAGFIYAMMLLAPVYIAPLFNDYTSLEEGELRDNILALAEENNIPADDVFVFTSSDQSNRITANVAGIGASTRIALGDTLVEQAELDEIRYVMAHEMGHYALGHTQRGMFFMITVVFVGFAFVHFSFGWVNARFGARWDIQNIGDLAGMPLFFALFTIYQLLLTPIQYNYTRIGEVEADRYGLEASREPDGFATTALRLSTYRELEPEPWEEFLFRHHPSGASRVGMAMEWKAEQLAAGAEDQTTELQLERARSIFATDE